MRLSEKGLEGESVGQGKRTAAGKGVRAIRRTSRRNSTGTRRIGEGHPEEFLLSVWRGE